MKKKEIEEERGKVSKWGWPETASFSLLQREFVSIAAESIERERGEMEEMKNKDQNSLPC